MAHGRSKDIAKKMIKIIKDDGWFLERQKGGHKIFKHPTKTGAVTVPFSITKNVELHILRQAGLRFNPHKKENK